MKNALVDLLKIRHGILSAPMGFVAGGKLAAAVSEAGGLGLIGGAYGDPDWLQAQIAAAGGERVGIGFITWSIQRDRRAFDLALDADPAAVMLSFGDPSGFAGEVQARGIPLILQVHSIEDARRALDLGVDILVAQGAEAGGHGRSRGTLSLVPAVVDIAGETPVAAAGGIADGRGAAAALALGAQGVLIGTRFFATHEALAPAGAKERLVASGGDATFRTNVVDTLRAIDWPTEYSGRVIHNDFVATWHGRDDEVRDDGELKAQYQTAAQDVRLDVATLFAGESLDLVGDVESAGDIVRLIVEETGEALRRAAHVGNG